MFAKMLKSVGYTIAFVLMLAATWIHRGCEAVRDVPGPTPTEARPPAEAPPKAGKAPPKAGRGARKPLTVRKAEQAARCWGPACYHDSGYRGARADDRIVRK